MQSVTKFYDVFLLVSQGSPLISMFVVWQHHLLTWLH